MDSEPTKRCPRHENLIIPILNFKKVHIVSFVQRFFKRQQNKPKINCS